MTEHMLGQTEALLQESGMQPLEVEGKAVLLARGGGQQVTFPQDNISVPQSRCRRPADLRDYRRRGGYRSRVRAAV